MNIYNDTMKIAFDFWKILSLTHRNTYIYISGEGLELKYEWAFFIYEIIHHLIDVSIYNTM
jgi:hypothetical protein